MTVAADMDQKPPKTTPISAPGHEYRGVQCKRHDKGLMIVKG
jgi:hypothetical protein